MLPKRKMKKMKGNILQKKEIDYQMQSQKIKNKFNNQIYKQIIKQYKNKQNNWKK